jgi:diguanylate cyclase (GGDEF)-like protein
MAQDNQQLQNLRNELKEREAEIKLLQDTFKLVSSELDLQRVFASIAQRALHLVDAETLLIPILDQNRTSYTYRGGAGKNSAEIIGESLPLDFGVCGWVWKHKKAWWRGILDELSESERNQWEKEAGTLIMVPLQGRKSFLGGIAAINKKDGLEFSRRDLDTLTLFASIVSIAIENALAVNQLENTQQTLLEHQHRIEVLNKQYADSYNKIQQLSLYDALTGLPNRTLFVDRINTQIQIAQRKSQKLSLVLIDISNFKTMNEALGHEAGDQILIEFSERLAEQVLPDETFSRLGNDEFVLLSPMNSLTQTINKIQLLIKHLERPFQINQNQVSISARFGISLYPEHGTDRSELFKSADISLDIAKKNNLDYHIYDKDQDQASNDHISLSVDIQQAFEQQQFELHYQPKLDIKTGRVLSAEALGRWKHPQKGFISPGIFIDALEQYNAIDRYTYLVIDMVKEHLQQWQQQGYQLKVAINISTRTLMNPDFVNKVEQCIMGTEIGHQLIFEITESLLLTENDHVYASLNRLRTLGIELSIDDFGTGYSSLSRLKKMPVNELKIDQSFIFDMASNPDDKIIVKSIIDLAHNLDLTVVAEGVETEIILQQLKQLGCDLVQGYLFSKPLTLSDFINYLQDAMHNKQQNTTL